MNIYEFMGLHPILTFFLALIICQVAGWICVTLPNRIMRHWNINKHGYPPAHCDADGDFRKVEDDK